MHVHTRRHGTVAAALLLIGQAVALADPRPVGSWSSEPFPAALTALQLAAWGRDASATRTGDLTVESTGQGVLRLTTTVRNGGGRRIREASTIEEIQFVLSDSPDTPGEYVVEVTSAERWYPANPRTRWIIEGVRLQLRLVPGNPDALDVEFEAPAGGLGSFIETFHREGSSEHR